MRLQSAGKEARDDDGSAAVYAVSQALEKALARELPIKLQGFVSSAEKNDTLRWRRRGAVQALTGGQPLAFPLAGSVDKVALVNYVTRPCDTHPMHADAAGFLFVSRTYQAQRAGDHGVLKLDRMHCRFVENRKGFGTPQLILEELARLGQARVRARDPAVAPLRQPPSRPRSRAARATQLHGSSWTAPWRATRR